MAHTQELKAEATPVEAYFIDNIKELPIGWMITPSDKPRVVLIDGSTASGKTLFEELLAKYVQLNINQKKLKTPLVRIETDWSLLARAERRKRKALNLNWAKDVANYFALHEVTIPAIKHALSGKGTEATFNAFNHETGELDHRIKVPSVLESEPQPLVIIQGVFAHSPEVIQALNECGIENPYRIVVDSNPLENENRARRRAASRNRDPEEVAREYAQIILPHWQEYSAEILPHANAVVRSEGFRFHVVTHSQNYHFELNSALPHPATDISQLGWPRSFAVSV